MLEEIYSLNNRNSWFKPKHIELYRDMCFRVAKESKAVRRKVGALVLSENGSIFLGYNGMPAGSLDDSCENEDFITRPEVIHAEENALMKALNEGVTLKDAILFLTDSPCQNCTNTIILNSGIVAIFYFRKYTKLSHLKDFDNHDIKIYYVDENDIETIRLQYVTHHNKHVKR